jgi:oligogalacturonide transporter
VAARFRITPATHQVLMAEIARLRSGGDRADVEPGVAQVCETLTGIAYDGSARKAMGR